MHEFYRALFESERLLPLNGRGGRFDPNEPIGLAGSDLVSFFLFERLPRERVELIIASNSSEARTPLLRDELAGVLGLPRMGRDGGQTPASAPPNAKAPAPAVASVIRDLFTAVNGASPSELREFVAQHFAADPAAPPIEQRLERFATLHERLGTLTPSTMWLDERGAVSVSVATANEGPATFVFDIASDAPKIRSIRVMVGG
jgi:hypothetical protein